MRTLRHITFLTLIVFLAFSAKSQSEMIDDPIAAMLDSLANQKVLEVTFAKPAFPKK